MRNLFLIGLLLLGAFMAGWFQINRSGDTTTIKINRQEIRDDTRQVIERGRDLLERQRQNDSQSADGQSMDEVPSPPSWAPTQWNQQTQWNQPAQNGSASWNPTQPVAPPPPPVIPQTQFTPQTQPGFQGPLQPSQPPISQPQWSQAQQQWYQQQQRTWQQTQQPPPAPRYPY